MKTKLFVWNHLFVFVTVATATLFQNGVCGFSWLDPSSKLPRTVASSIKTSGRVSVAWMPTNPVARLHMRGFVSEPLASFSARYSSGSSRNEGSNSPATSGRNGDIVDVFLNGLWKGVTLPFPSLRGLAESRRRSSKMKKDLVVGWSVRESLLAIAGYLAIGVVAYSYVFERWSILDSLYFSCVCFSTVGYGDLCPKSLGGRLFTCFFGLGGIVFLGTAVATVASHVVQAELEAVHVARQTSRQRIMHFVDHVKLPHFVKELAHLNHHDNTTSVDQHLHLPHFMQQFNNVTSPSWLSRGASIVKRILPSLGVVALGGIWIGRLNGWNWIDSIYFAVVTASTIGLGDFAPSTRAARLWAIFFIPLSVATAGELLSSLATALVQRRQKAIFRTLMERDLTLQHLQAMDLDSSGRVSREEYVQFMLLEMGHVSLEEIQELKAQFERLDVAKSGYLDQVDLQLLADLRKQNVSHQTEARVSVLE